MRAIQFPSDCLLVTLMCFRSDSLCIESDTIDPIFWLLNFSALHRVTYESLVTFQFYPLRPPRRCVYVNINRVECLRVGDDNFQWMTENCFLFLSFEKLPRVSFGNDTPSQAVGITAKGPGARLEILRLIKENNISIRLLFKLNSFHVQTISRSNHCQTVTAAWWLCQIIINENFLKMMRVMMMMG